MVSPFLKALLNFSIWNCKRITHSPYLPSSLHSHHSVIHPAPGAPSTNLLANRAALSAILEYSPLVPSSHRQSYPIDTSADHLAHDWCSPHSPGRYPVVVANPGHHRRPWTAELKLFTKLYTKPSFSHLKQERQHHNTILVHSSFCHIRVLAVAMPQMHFQVVLHPI